jgi:2-haloacid dehalogenase
VINKSCWERLETGEWTRDQVLVRRFEILFAEYDVNCDGTLVARSYEANLSIGHYFLPGAEEAVKRLREKYRLFLVSNGTACVQHGRLTSAGLYPMFEKVFVSQEVGYNKPAIEYFDRVFAAIPGFDREKAIIVGDSLTSDILGGIRAGIRTCWVNPDHKTGDIKADHEIEALSQLEALLETL